MDDKTIKIIKVLNNPTNQRLISILKEKPETPSEIVKKTGKNETMIVRKLREMENLGILSSFWMGRNKYYKLEKIQITVGEEAKIQFHEVRYPCFSKESFFVYSVYGAFVLLFFLLKNHYLTFLTLLWLSWHSFSFIEIYTLFKDKGYFYNGLVLLLSVVLASFLYFGFKLPMFVFLFVVFVFGILVAYSIFYSREMMYHDREIEKRGKVVKIICFPYYIFSKIEEYVRG